MFATLVITTFLFSGTADGGASVNTINLPMKTMEICLENVKNAEQTGSISETNYKFGRYKVIAYCVKN